MSTFAGRPLVVDTKASQIRQRLTDAIISGELRPGDRIVLDEIARELGVSKIPLREALSSLEGAGLVVTTPHAGPRVAPLPRHEIHGVYQLRAVVEPLAMRLALERDHDLAGELSTINDRMRASLATADDTELSAINAEFHLAVARATTFATVFESVDELLVKIRRFRALSQSSADNWEGAIAEHDVIIAAVRDRDVDAAIEAMRAHVETRGAMEAPDELGVSSADG